MVKLFKDNPAFGTSGIKPRWTHGSKQGIGTAYSTSSKIWFSLWNGVLTEIFYPTIDKPQTRDTQYLVSDGENWFHAEKQHMETEIEQIDCHSLGYRITNSDRDGKYQIVKEVISDPHLACVLQHTQFKTEQDLGLYLLCAPHLEIGGANNSGYVVEVAGRKFLVAEKEGTWLAMGATVPFKKLSCGYVGESDGWQDLADNYVMDWEFDTAENGNIALMGQLDLSGGNEFTTGIAFGNTLHKAITTLLQSLDIAFDEQKSDFVTQWQRTCSKLKALDKAATDDGNLYHSSFSLILAHEDKSYPGALIASLSIPWGQEKADDADYGGYHLVWPRDLYNSATALLAAGYAETPLRTLMYLATCQQSDGGFAQNFWIDGTPDRESAQLDEVAYPILLAWKLKQESALRNFDPYPMVIGAARYLIEHSPVTPQERWEQSSGFSAATLATVIAGLICAAVWTREKGNDRTAEFIETYADFLESHIETWTVTSEGTLVEDIPRHYIRITPAQPDDIHPNENPNSGTITVPHRHPDSISQFPAKEIVDPSFLQLVRYGIRPADDPLIIDSLKVVDAVLKTDTPHGPVWKRYNHDGHGQRDDGSAWDGWGTGRSWILLTGERGQYELARGNDPQPYIKAMEGFSAGTGLLPEQVWDAEDIPEAHMYLGEATGSAMPLLWSHSEYIKLLRSSLDGKVYDYVPEVGDRYLNNRDRQSLEVWKSNRQITQIELGTTLRIIADKPFKLRYSNDDWSSKQDIESTEVESLNFHFVDLNPEEAVSIKFNFYWTGSGDWQQGSYSLEVVGVAS